MAEDSIQLGPLVLGLKKKESASPSDQALDLNRKKIIIDKSLTDIEYISIHQNPYANGDEEDWKIIKIDKTVANTETILIATGSHDRKTNLF